MTEITDVKSYIHLAEIEITYKCNLDCEHCYNKQDRAKRDMSFENIIRLIQELSNEPIQKLVITGGEASLHPDFERLCNYIKDNRKKSFSNVRHFVLQSNGFIEKYSIELLKAFDIMHLSYDIDENELRDINSSNIEELAEKLNNEGLFAYLFCTLHKKNIAFIDSIIERVVSKKLYTAFNFCVDANSIDPSFILSNIEKRDLTIKLIECEKNEYIRVFKHPYAAIIRNNQSSGYIGNKGGCTAGIASLILDSEGELMPCPFLRIKCGNVLKKSIKYVWLNSKELSLIRNRGKYNKCGDCRFVSYCGGCRGSAYKITGSLMGQDNDCFVDIHI